MYSYESSRAVMGGRITPETQSIIRRAGLKIFGTLASKIQVNKDRCEDKTALEEDKADSEDFFRFFPDIFWLLRDITFPLTIETKGEVKEVETKAYILLEILNTGESSHKKTNLTEQMKLKKAIIDYFPTFDALKLPIPSSKADVIRKLNDMACLENANEVNQEFAQGIETLRNTLNRKMKPKKAWPQVGNMYGPHLAKFLQTCVTTINSRSTLPCIQTLWEDVITSLLDGIVNKALTLYETEMSSVLSCDEKFNEIDILQKHEVAVCKATDLYNDETRHINDAQLRQKYFRKLQDVIVAFEKDTSAVTGGILARYIFDNEDASERFCRKVADRALRDITRLRDERSGSFESIQEMLTCTIGDYIRRSRGPKKVEVLQKHLLKEVRKVVFDKNFLKGITMSEEGFLAKVWKSHSFEERHEEKMRKRMEDLLKQGAHTLEQWYRTNKSEEENLRHERSRLTRSARRREERAWDTYFDQQRRQQRIDHEEMQNKLDEGMINRKKIYEYNTELLQKELKERETDIHTLRENKRKTRIHKRLMEEVQDPGNMKFLLARRGHLNLDKQDVNPETSESMFPKRPRALLQAREFLGTRFHLTYSYGDVGKMDTEGIRLGA
ncbi:guanylate-binding protein 4-like [Ptychodera flava]|uniref:guanylate-binding protein 4-like n=1 Tax=Ptychodera flava TaxID=63121 RepID=UPI00396A707F